MKKLSFLLALAVTATTTVAVLAGDGHDTATLTQISGYRRWTRVNPQPIKIEAPVIVSAGTFSIPTDIAV